jgi:hypothetical protein
VDSADDRNVVLREGDRKFVKVSIENRRVVVVVDQRHRDHRFELPRSVVGTNAERIFVPDLPVEILGNRNFPGNRMDGEGAVRVVDELVGNV